MKSFALLLLIGVIAASTANALDFKVTGTIDLGQGGGSSLSGAKWSPDGSHLAFFRDGQLVLSDTMGTLLPVRDFKGAPYRFEWVSDSLILMSLQPDIQSGNRRQVFIASNLMGDTASIKDEDILQATIDGSVRGPLRSVNGQVYFEIKGDTYLSIKIAPQRLRDTCTNPDAQFRRLVIGESVYVVNGDNHQWTPIGRLPSAARGEAVVRKDMKFFMHGGWLCNVRDSETIVLDTILRTIPEGTSGCGIVQETINPSYDEVAFVRECDDGETFVVWQFGTYVFGEDHLTLLSDSLPGSGSWEWPDYAPDGLKIAYVSDGHVYIIFRKALIE